MAQKEKSGGGVLEGVRDTVSKNPAAERLFGEVETFVRDRALDLVDSLGDRIGDVTDRLEDFASNGGSLKRAGKAMSEGDGPLKAGLKAVGGGLKDRVSDMIGSGGGGDDGQKATVIAESIEIGVPVSVAYNQWTQFHEFGQFTKGVQSVNQEDETHTNWKAKIFWSTRSWDATITEQIPDERIAWESDGDKGSVNGVVTFHELAPNLTKVLMELEYHPKGFMEKTGNLWRAQGRRARLDLKHFRRFVMMRGEETGAWRGEVHDGEVTKSPDDKGQGRRQRPGRGGRDESRRRSGSGDDDRSSRRGRRSRRSREDMRRERRRTRSQRERRDRPERRRRSDNGSGDDASSSSSSNGSAKKTSARRKRTAPTKKTTSSSRGNGNGNGSAKKAPARRKRTSPTKKTTSSRSTSAPAKKSTSTRKRASSPPRKSTARKSASPRKTTAGSKKTTAGRKSTSGRKATSAARKTSSGRKTTARKSTTKRSTARKRS